VFVEDGIGASGSCPMSVVLGVTSGAGAGATAAGFGREIGGLLGAAAFFAGAFFAGAFFAGAFLRAAFLATFFLPAFLAFAGRVFFLATLFLAAARFVLAAERFLPFFPFFFAMVSHLLAGLTAVHESSPEKVRCHLRLMTKSMVA
jgi:hypothetical protein